MEQHRDRARVGQDAGDVRGGREGTDAQRPVGVPDQLPLQLGQVDATVGVLVDGHDIRDGLAPRQLVGVVLVRADEHHRPLAGRDLVAQSVALVELGGQPQPEHIDELVDGTRGAGAREDDHVPVGVARQRPRR